MRAAKEEKNKGNEVKIGYQKLTINGKTKYWQKDRGMLAQGSQNSPRTR